MSDKNNTPNVEIETSRDGYRVTVNGKPATGPLSILREAAKAANQIEGRTNNTYDTLLFIMVAVSIGITVVIGVLTSDWRFAFTVGGFGLLGMMVFGAWAILTS